MNASTLATYCAVRELVYVEQGLSQGVKGAWFQNRSRERMFVKEQDIHEFTEKVRREALNHRQLHVSFTS
jgi:hypothetical protein